MEHLCTRTRWQLITPSRPPASAGGRFFMPHAEESDDTVIHCSSPSATNHTHHLQTGLAAVTHPCSRPGSPHPTAAHGHSVHPFRGGRLNPRLALCTAFTPYRWMFGFYRCRLAHVPMWARALPLSPIPTHVGPYPASTHALWMGKQTNNRPDTCVSGRFWSEQCVYLVPCTIYT